MNCCSPAKRCAPAAGPVEGSSQVRGSNASDDARRTNGRASSGTCLRGTCAIEQPPSRDAEAQRPLKRCRHAGAPVLRVRLQTQLRPSHSSADSPAAVEHVDNNADTPAPGADHEPRGGLPAVERAPGIVDAPCDSSSPALARRPPSREAELEQPEGAGRRPRSGRASSHRRPGSKRPRPRSPPRAPRASEASCGGGVCDSDCASTGDSNSHKGAAASDELLGDDFTSEWTSECDASSGQGTTGVGSGALALVCPLCGSTEDLLCNNRSTHPPRVCEGCRGWTLEGGLQGAPPGAFELQPGALLATAQMPTPFAAHMPFNHAGCTLPASPAPFDGVSPFQLPMEPAASLFFQAHQQLTMGVWPQLDAGLSTSSNSLYFASALHSMSSQSALFPDAWMQSQLAGEQMRAAHMLAQLPPYPSQQLAPLLPVENPIAMTGHVSSQSYMMARTQTTHLLTMASAQVSVSSPLCNAGGYACGL